MSERDGNTVILRKARSGRAEHQARGMSPSKALRLALAQTADALYDMPVAVAAVEQVEISQTGLDRELGGGGLLILLDGPDGARGALRMDLGLLGALIEVQTTGRVSGRATADRAVTRTDAAISAPLIDAMLARFEAQLREETPAHWAQEFRYGVMMEDVRGMQLALTAPAFHVLRLMVETGDVAQPGALTLILPAPPETPEADDPKQEAVLARTLEACAMGVPVRLEAVLGRIKMPLGEVCRLKPGDTLPVALDKPMRIWLEASEKHVVAMAHLGQSDGLRAVRLLLPQSERAALPTEVAEEAPSRIAPKRVAPDVEDAALSEPGAAPPEPSPSDMKAFADQLSE
ncbi:FliM/FliN family flagellar motor switch protein [Roseovarius sp. LXJ103]|uniref:FliM/FliN family flagellar motor switch protein n=1 Tax=Roseovarius carneus TaxID=2853164 RepID=UPI000D611F4F|nr:FliM/FliN family flagellar motor switch protein [Roseovarius carneus]MBZ8118785.1 FliM/FliN family flagellar motor switch protein [Roseovarius carneus]PWE35543.1 flagellar motor switch protein FliM [Pelagicola sp. LXJ1103]